MTTFVLANKLMSIKINKSEFEKIKHEKVINIREQHKYLSTLRKVLQHQTIEKSCRLCLKQGVIKVFDNTNEINHAEAIKTIFGVEISQNDGKPQYICMSCGTTIKMAVRLKQTAEITQWRLQQELEIVADSTSECNLDEYSKIHGGYFHLQGAIVTRDWTCSKCRKVFSNKDEFKEHELLPSCRTRFRSYICETCGSKFKSMSLLKRHRLIHTGELQHQCPQCPYRARTKYALAVHSRLHSGERPLRCPECPATFPNASNLASHRRRHLPPAYHCDVCQRGFKFKEALLNHIATQHRNAKPFNCSACAKSFATRKMIRRHELKTHNRPKLRSGVSPIYTRQQEGN
ncbi:unnamed protein product, partial [Iphiclides podalirius]